MSASPESGLGRAAIAARLRELGGYLRLAGEGTFRARAYETAAAAIDALGPRFDDLLAQDRLVEVPGIGDKLAATIATLHRTGTTTTLDRLRAEMPPGVLELAGLPGLSLAKVRLLHEKLGIDGAGSLQEAAQQGRVREVRGFGPRTEAKILAGLAAPRPDAPQLLLQRAREIAEGLRAELAEVPGVVRTEVAGAVRRWRELIGTVRLVAAASDPAASLAAFLARAPGGEPLSISPGPEEAAARFRLVPVGVAEILIVTPDRFAAALVRESAGPAHLSALEARANSRGTPLGQMIAPDEAGIYAALDLPEIPPELREEPDDLARAEAGDDFRDLIDLPDVCGFVHCHTTASDGRHDLREMAAGAAARGMAYLTITDHSPTASYAGGLSPERLQAQSLEIAALASSGEIGIDILHGTESDIRGDGTLDYPIDVLAGLDIVIASIHNRFGMDAPAMTERLVTAMRQPVFKIWGHGLGRILLHRPPVACDVEAVLDAAAAGRTAIEINGDPHRLDLEPRWLRRARARGLRFVISVDAHSIRDYDNLVFGVHLARRAGIRRDEVLNTTGAAAFRSAVRPPS
jgi:DNA polymerase (family 10)